MIFGLHAVLPRLGFAKWFYLFSAIDKFVDHLFGRVLEPFSALQLYIYFGQFVERRFKLFCRLLVRRVLFDLMQAVADVVRGL